MPERLNLPIKLPQLHLVSIDGLVGDPDRLEIVALVDHVRGNVDLDRS